MTRPLSFYYDFMSPPSRAMWIILKMSGTPFEDCPIALRKGEQRSKEFKNINRFQKLPAIVDNDFKLAESVAILRYINKKGNISPALYPSDVKEQARVDEFLEWQPLNTRLGCGMFFMHTILEPLRTGEKPKAEKTEKLKVAMEQHLNNFEKIWLADGAFVTGDRLTAADIFAACEIEQIKTGGYDACDKYLKIKEWINRVRKETSPHYEIAHKYINKMASLNAKL